MTFAPKKQLCPGCPCAAQPQVPEGYVLVPKEPSRRMKIWGAARICAHIRIDADTATDCWRAMIAAAQEGE